MIGRFGDLPPAERRRATETLASARATDIGRWSQSHNLKSNWAERAQVAARLVEPRVRLLDIGCGSMDVERFLDPSVTYLPADVVRRDDRTVVCDLNAGELPDVRADFISLLGVIEYVHDVPGLFAKLRRTGARVIGSYNPVDLGKPDRDRRAQGWFNDLTSAELCAVAASAGFQLVGVITIDPQRVYEWSPAE